MKPWSKLASKNILVTGGTGFVGGRLVEELLRLHASVIVLDIELNSKSTFALNKLDNKAKLEMVDIKNKDEVLETFKKYTPELVFHLAAYSTVPSSFENPCEALETNIMGTVNMLEAARKSNFVKGIVVASSDKAYGKLDYGKYRETDPLRGDHPYDVSKSAADLISLAYHKTYGLPVVVTRFGNVYGEGDLHFNRIIPGICKAIITNKTLEIRSDGTYVRDYVYVKDVVNGYMFLMKNIQACKGEAFNFSSKDTYSVIELIRKIELYLNIKIPYKILNIARNEIPYQHLDDTKIRNLGWKRNYSLKKILPGMFLWYKKILKK